MLSVLFYLFLFVICTFFLVLSAVALLLTWPFDKSRRIVHELSRILVRIFYAVPPLWKFRVTGREYIDRRKPYVIVVNHQAGLDIPTLYFVPLNFRWVSKREVFKVPFFGQFLLLHGDICINRGHATGRDGEGDPRRKAVAFARGFGGDLSEGTRSHDGEIHRFKAGAFTLAREAGVEILPVVLDGTTTMIGRNGMFNWRNKLTVSILPPVSAERVAAADPKELMEQVRASMCVRLAEIRKQK